MGAHQHAYRETDDKPLPTFAHRRLLPQKPGRAGSVRQPACPNTCPDAPEFVSWKEARPRARYSADGSEHSPPARAKCGLDTTHGAGPFRFRRGTEVLAW